MAKYVVSGGLTGMPVAQDIQFIDFSAVDPATPYAEAKAIPWNMEINPDYGALSISLLSPVVDCGRHRATRARA